MKKSQTHLYKLYSPNLYNNITYNLSFPEALDRAYKIVQSTYKITVVNIAFEMRLGLQLLSTLSFTLKQNYICT